MLLLYRLLKRLTLLASVGSVHKERRTLSVIVKTGISCVGTMARVSERPRGQWLRHAGAPILIVAIVASLLAGLPGRSLAVHAQGDRDADSRALVQRLTLDRATTIVVLQKKADEREQELFEELERKNRALRSREAALRREVADRAAAVAELASVTRELASVNSARQDAVDQLAVRDRQFAAEIDEYRRQVASIANSPDPRKREALQRYANGDRAGGFRALVDIQRAEIQAVAAGWSELAALALDRMDRGEMTLDEVVPFYEEAQRLDPDQQWGWIALARLHRDAGRLPEAMRAAQESVTRATNDRSRSAGLAELGDVLVAAGELATARTRYEESLTMRSGWRRPTRRARRRSGTSASASASSGMCSSRRASSPPRARGMKRA